MLRRAPAGNEVSGVPALGAEVTLAQPRRHPARAQVDEGNGHASVRSPEVHFGLGHVPARTRLGVTIAWRDWQGRPRQIHLQLIPGRWAVRLPEKHA